MSWHVLVCSKCESLIFKSSVSCIDLVRVAEAWFPLLSREQECNLIDLKEVFRAKRKREWLSDIPNS